MQNVRNVIVERGLWHRVWCAPARWRRRDAAVARRRLDVLTRRRNTGWRTWPWWRVPVIVLIITDNRALSVCALTARKWAMGALHVLRLPGERRFSSCPESHCYSGWRFGLVHRSEYFCGWDGSRMPWTFWQHLSLRWYFVCVGFWVLSVRLVFI